MNYNIYNIHNGQVIEIQLKTCWHFVKNAGEWNEKRYTDFTWETKEQAEAWLAKANFYDMRNIVSRMFHGKNYLWGDEI